MLITRLRLDIPISLFGVALLENKHQSATLLDCTPASQAYTSFSISEAKRQPGFG